MQVCQLSEPEETRVRRPRYVGVGQRLYDLAQASGGISQRRLERPGAVSNLLFVVQHLPFLAYEQLVRRNRFLPNWYFGTNYQNWIVAHLLIEGAKWYRKAEKEQQRSGNSHYLSQTQLSLAEIDHRLICWSRARHRYSSLMESRASETAIYSYQRAQVALGQGRILFDERKLEAAEADLQDALEGFAHFEDNRSTGIAGELLGQLYVAQNQPEKAIQACKQSLSAYQV